MLFISSKRMLKSSRTGSKIPSIQISTQFEVVFGSISRPKNTNHTSKILYLIVSKKLVLLPQSYLFC